MTTLCEYVVMAATSRVCAVTHTGPNVRGEHLAPGRPLVLGVGRSCGDALSTGLGGVVVAAAATSVYACDSRLWRAFSSN
jgi:hypothetical protein